MTTWWWGGGGASWICAQRATKFTSRKYSPILRLAVSFIWSPRDSRPYDLNAMPMSLLLLTLSSMLPLPSSRMLVECMKRSTCKSLASLELSSCKLFEFMKRSCCTYLASLKLSRCKLFGFMKRSNCNYLEPVSCKLFVLMNRSCCESLELSAKRSNCRPSAYLKLKLL